VPASAARKDVTSSDRISRGTHQRLGVGAVEAIAWTFARAIIRCDARKKAGATHGVAPAGFSSTRGLRGTS
jgi:hypothetical protein